MIINKKFHFQYFFHLYISDKTKYLFWVRQFIFFLHKGISYFRNLKYLEVLNIRVISRISPDSFSVALCYDPRPTLRELCLPDLPFNIEIWEVLLAFAPNLKHLCTGRQNQKFIVCISHISTFYLNFLLFFYFYYLYRY